MRDRMSLQEVCGKELCLLLGSFCMIERTVFTFAFDYPVLHMKYHIRVSCRDLFRSLTCHYRVVVFFFCHIVISNLVVYARI